ALEVRDPGTFRPREERPGTGDRRDDVVPVDPADDVIEVIRDENAAGAVVDDPVDAPEVGIERRSAAAGVAIVKAAASGPGEDADGSGERNPVHTGVAAVGPEDPAIGLRHDRPNRVHVETSPRPLSR